MDDGSFADVSNPKDGTCLGVVKTEPVEYDDQNSIWNEMQPRNVKAKGPEIVSVKLESENGKENGLETITDLTKTDNMCNSIKDDISDEIKVERMEENGLESVGNEPKTPNEEEKKHKDVSAVIKTEKIEEDQDDYASVKINPTTTEKQGGIHSESTDVKEEFDLEEQVIVMNENSNFKTRVKPDTSNYSHICPICDMAFRWPQQLRNHITYVHEGDSPYTCKLCGKGFEHLKSFRDHKYVHTEERPHCCKLCPSRFKMKGGLNKHMRDIHGDNKLRFKCEHCSKEFKCKEKLISHFAVHQSEKQYACEICGKKFNRKPNLKDHLVTHSKEKNFECSECGMKFNRKYAMKIHKRNHLEVRPYKCDFCDKSFSQSHALKSHLRLHTGERPYKCNYCDRSFKQLGTWQIHEKRHRGEKDFVCGVCGRAFLIHRRLTEHMRTHTGEKPYQCDLCPYRGATSTGLKYHQRTHERRLLREFKKALEAELNEKGTDSTTNSVAKETEAMRKVTGNEVKENVGKVVKSKPKVRKNANNVIDMKVEKSDNSEPVEETKRKTKHIIEKIVEDGVKRKPKTKKIKEDQNKKKKQGLSEKSLLNMSYNPNSFPPLDQNNPILFLSIPKDKKKSPKKNTVKAEEEESSCKDLIQENMKTSTNNTAQLVLFDDTFSDGYSETATVLPNGKMPNGLKNSSSMIDQAIKNLADSIKRDCCGKTKVHGDPSVLNSSYGSRTGSQGVSPLNKSKIGASGINFQGNRNKNGTTYISHLSKNFSSKNGASAISFQGDRNQNNPVYISLLSNKPSSKNGALGISFQDKRNHNNPPYISLLSNKRSSEIGASGISLQGHRNINGAQYISNNLGSRNIDHTPNSKLFHQTDIIELSSSSDSELDEDGVKFESMDGGVIKKEVDQTFGAKDSALMECNSQRETDCLNVTAVNFVKIEPDVVNNSSDTEETWNGLSERVTETEHNLVSNVRGRGERLNGVSEDAAKSENTEFDLVNIDRDIGETLNGVSENAAKSDNSELDLDNNDSDREEAWNDLNGDITDFDNSEHDLENKDYVRNETWNGVLSEDGEYSDVTDDVEQSNTIVAETDDFIIVRNESVSTFEH